MDAYTVVMEFRGGTYISQVKANNLRNCLKKWADSLEFDDIKYFGVKALAELKREAQIMDLPIKINGVKNVWCCCMSIKAGFILINIIKTSLS